MDQKTLREYEAKCVQDEAPACQSSCPIHVDARTIIKLMAENNAKKARIELDKYMPLSILSAFLCEGDCQKACKMGKIGEAIDMPMIERACVQNSDAPKLMALPSNGKKVAIAGSALSSLCLAFEMAKKGYVVTVYHVENIGKNLLDQAKEKLPLENLEKALEILSSLKVQFEELKIFDNSWLETALEEHLIVYLGEDDKAVSESNLFEKIDGTYSKNPISLTSSREKVLAGGYFKEKVHFCKCIADAKIAMNSIVRILQNVSPETAREKEAPYETKLFTNLDRYEATTKIIAENILIPTLNEASEEAKRCIQCSCLECVKACSYMQHYKTYPKKALREAYNNLAIAQGNRAANTMINSCTQCGLCAKICPNDLNLGDFLELAKKEMVRMKHMPPSAHEFALEDMAFSNSKNVQFYRNENKEANSKYVFFPGCQLPSILPREVEKAYAHLANVLEGGVAFHLACCGMPASWSGNSNFLEQHIECIKKDWEERNKPIYIFACASCQAFYQRYVPDMQILSLWEVMVNSNLSIEKEDSEENQLDRASDKSLENFSLHDPCNSRSFPEMQESVRKLLQQLGKNIEEMTFTGENTRCCGFGGLASEANLALSNSFADERNKESQYDMLVYCAICRERMQKAGKNALHILELIFPIDDLNLRKSKSLLSLYERQEKRIEFRKNILKSIWNEQMEEQINIEFTLADGLEEILSERKIVHADIAQVLQDVEKNGASFYSESEDVYLACYRPRQVSYWVRYSKKEDEPYQILDAYSHRMIVPGIQGEGAPASFTNFSCCE